MKRIVYLGIIALAVLPFLLLCKNPRNYQL